MYTGCIPLPSPRQYSSVRFKLVTDEELPGSATCGHSTWLHCSLTIRGRTLPRIYIPETTIELKRRYTSWQVARGAMPDAEKFNRMYLIKNVSVLRATYQIRLLVFKAVESKTQLVIRVPTACVFHESLEALVNSYKKSVIRESY